MKHKTKTLRFFLPIFLAAAILSALLLWFFPAVNHLSAGQHEEGRVQLEIALRRATVACYATEGIYPPTLDYLTQHYGIQIDKSRYSVFYEIFADNLMPEITVLVKET
jgi:hypothetical protein